MIGLLPTDSYLNQHLCPEIAGFERILPQRACREAPCIVHGRTREWGAAGKIRLPRDKGYALIKSIIL